MRRRRALARVQRDARLSAAWFENLPRTIRYDAPTFFTLLLARRSRLLRHMPVTAYLSLRTIYTKLNGLAFMRSVTTGGVRRDVRSRAPRGIAGHIPEPPRR
jgi:hypothetical protein